MILTSIVVYVPNVQAIHPAYNAPCKGGDWEHRGQCCPAYTSQIAHSMCFTKEEYQHRKEQDKDRLACMFDKILKTDTAGVLDCIKK